MEVGSEGFGPSLSLFLVSLVFSARRLCTACLLFEPSRCGTGTSQSLLHACSSSTDQFLGGTRPGSASLDFILDTEFPSEVQK